MRRRDGGLSGSLSRRVFIGSTAGALTGASFSHAAADDEPSLFVYPDRLSYEPGDLLRLQLSTNALTYDLRIERVGAERRLVWSKSGLKGSEHPVPGDASAVGCRWPTALEIPIAADWASGYYEITTNPPSVFIDHRGRRPPFRSYFIVRSATPGRATRILLQLATNTDNAYCHFGGYSLYAFNGRNGIQGRQVSFERPLPGNCARRWELPFIAWCEVNGYKLDYAVNNDLEDRPQLLADYKLVLSVGHDEYWSKPMRDALEAFIERGGNAAFFSGNVCCWQVRSEVGGLVCYKEHFREDPVFRPQGPNPTLTTLWSHPLVARPENLLTGVGFLHGGFHLSHGQYMDGSGAFTVERPEHWLFAGTGAKRGDTFGGKQTIVGYECDGCDFSRDGDGRPMPTGSDGTPHDFAILATAPAKWAPVAAQTFPELWPNGQQGAACLGLRQHANGGTEFTVGTTDWSHGLYSPADPFVDRITRNVLNRLSAASA